MWRRAFLTALPALLAAWPALAYDPTVERILRELRGLGYADISVERTLLGRSRILADSPDATREIIVNPVTGEILRDLWLPVAANGGGTGSLIRGGTSDDSDDVDDGSNSGSGSSGSGSDDDGNDDSGDGDSGSDDGGGDDGGKGRGRGRGGDDD